MFVGFAVESAPVSRASCVVSVGRYPTECSRKTWSRAFRRQWLVELLSRAHFGGVDEARRSTSPNETYQWLVLELYLSPPHDRRIDYGDMLLAQAGHNTANMI